MGKATDFKFGQNIHTVHPNKRPLKILEKRECGHIQGLPNFLDTPIISEMGKPVKLGTPENFQGHILGKSHGHLSDSSAFPFLFDLKANAFSCVFPLSSALGMVAIFFNLTIGYL